MAAAPSRAPVAAWRPGTQKSAATQDSVLATEGAATGAFSFFLFCVLTFVVVGRPNDYIQALVPLRLALVMTPLTVLATLLQRGDHGPFRHREAQLYLAFYSMMIVGVPLAMHRAVSFDYVITGYSSNVIYFFLFVTHVTTRARLARIWMILVFGAAVFSLVSLSRGGVWSGRFYVGQGGYDPNDVAYVELALLPFAICLLMTSSNAVSRLMALVSVVTGMLVALFTGSRGGMLGIVVFVLLFIIVRVGNLKAAHKALLLMLLVGAAVVNADKINFERYRTLTNLETDYNMEEGGRWDTWKKGLTILAGRPLTGVGADNFPMAIGNYRQALGVLPKWQAAHNSFIQVLVEVGVIGGILWLMLVTTTAKTFWRLRHRPSSSGRGEIAVWAGVLFVGFVAQLVSSLFISMGYSVFFTVFFAVAVALKQIDTPSRQGLESHSTADDRNTFPGRGPRDVRTSGR
jgi:O-antigen ligase